jgi:hypothetical protein
MTDYTIDDLDRDLDNLIATQPRGPGTTGHRLKWYTSFEYSQQAPAEARVCVRDCETGLEGRGANLNESLNSLAAVIARRIEELELARDFVECLVERGTHEA